MRVSLINAEPADCSTLEEGIFRRRLGTEIFLHVLDDYQSHPNWARGSERIIHIPAFELDVILGT